MADTKPVTVFHSKAKIDNSKKENRPGVQSKEGVTTPTIKPSVSTQASKPVRTPNVIDTSK